MERIVIKRTGEKEYFDINRIHNVIKVAFAKCYYNELVKDAITKEGIINECTKHKIPDERDMVTINQVVESVDRILNDKGKVYKVTDIQEVIRTELMDRKLFKVAEEYIFTSKKRDEERLASSKFISDIQDIVKVRNIENSNANVDERGFSGRKLRASSELHKFIALNKMISPKIKDLFLRNLLYINDLDCYDVGQHNCTALDLYDILSRGFKTRNTDIRRANSIQTAYQLTAVVFQIQSQVQFGGVSSNAFDYQLAPFLRISFKKVFKEVLSDYNFYSNTNYVIPEDLMHMVNDTKEFVTNKKYRGLNIPLTIFKMLYDRTLSKITKILEQSSEGLVHNLNSLESRSGRMIGRQGVVGFLH